MKLARTRGRPRNPRPRAPFSPNSGCSHRAPWGLENPAMLSNPRLGAAPKMKGNAERHRGTKRSLAAWLRGWEQVVLGCRRVSPFPPRGGRRVPAWSDPDGRSLKPFCNMMDHLTSYDILAYCHTHCTGVCHSLSYESCATITNHIHYDTRQ